MGFGGGGLGALEGGAQYCLGGRVLGTALCLVERGRVCGVLCVVGLGGVAIQFEYARSVVVKRLLILLVVGLLVSCGDKTQHLVNGEPVPAFELPNLQGEKVAVPEVGQGQLLVLRFWADWCPFCAKEMTALEPVYRAYQAQGLVFLAINVRQDRDTAQAFIDKLNITYPVLLDEEGEVSRAYSVMGLPTTYFVGREGRLHGKIIGESTPEMMEKMLIEIINKQAN